MPIQTNLTYGNPSQPNICLRCKQPIKNHKLGGKAKIAPTQATTDLARSILKELVYAYIRLQAKLKIEERGAKESTMIGVAIATFKNPKNNQVKKEKFGTASGTLGAALLKTINQKTPGLQLITEPNAADISTEEKTFQEGGGRGNNITKITPTVKIHRNNELNDAVLKSKEHKLKISGDAEFRRTRNDNQTLPRVELGRNPAGACAAQKLIDAIFAYAWKTGMLVTNIDMSEVFWNKSNAGGNYKTGDLAPSCTTCEKILPWMLCDLVESYEIEVVS
jgi:hypothetical protein